MWHRRSISRYVFEVHFPVRRRGLFGPAQSQFVEISNTGEGKVYQLIPEDGYVCLGDVYSDHSYIIELSNFCCVRQDLTVIGHV